MTKDKHAIIIEAIEAVKKGTFKATAIKLELEAQFNRRDSSGGDDVCSDCEGAGRVDCGECDGGGDSYCYECDERGTIDCGHCDGEGEVENPAHLLDATADPMIPCEGCDAEGTIECDNCDGHGRVDCGDCDGRGTQDCDYCDGPTATVHNGYNFRNENTCHDWMMEHLAPLGLAERRETRTPNMSHITGSFWHPIGPMKYAEFYNDGSVDSEFTFTIMIDDPENVFLLPKIIKVWNQLGEAIGQGVDVRGAGMHTAFLNSPDGHYKPNDRPSEARIEQFRNYQKSMQLLLPAMYFLASGDENSRALNFRKPQVQCVELNSGQKYSAIAYRNSALEFRAFNTCYDNPDQILDNIVVMKNTLKYWRKNYKASGLSKITPNITFGNDKDNTLARFYTTETHLNLLNKGLEKLKPEYLTIREIKKQRKFNINRRYFKTIDQTTRANARLSYLEYEDRFSWSLMVRRKRYEADLIEQQMYNRTSTTDMNRVEVLQEVERMVNEAIASEEGRKKTIEQHIEEQIQKFNNDNRGLYQLVG